MFEVFRIRKFKHFKDLELEASKNAKLQKFKAPEFAKFRV